MSNLGALPSLQLSAGASRVHTAEAGSFNVTEEEQQAQLSALLCAWKENVYSGYVVE